MAKEMVLPQGQYNVNKAIKAIGQELIKRAEDISNDIERVKTISIYAILTPDEITNFDITKNYVAEYEEEI